MELKKRTVVKAYVSSFGNITMTCKAGKISRTTFYQWLKDDQEFKTVIESSEPDEVFVDYAEKALIGKIKKGDTAAIIFALKSKGKHRGYVERQELTGKDGQEIKGFNYIIPATNGSHKSNGQANGKATPGMAEANGHDN